MADSTQSTSETPSQPAADPNAAAHAAASAESPPPSSESKTPPAAAVTPPAADPAKPAEGAKAPESAADGKPGEPAKPPEGKAPEAKPPAAADAVPENYTITPPEGLQIDPGMLPALLPALKEAKLTQGQLQGVATAFLEWQRGAPQRLLERDLAVTLKDPEIGGLNWGRTRGYVNQALSAFTDVEFRSFLDKAGIANRLEFVRVFERIGRAMSGDVMVRGAPSSAPEESLADRLYSRAKKVNQ